MSGGREKAQKDYGVGRGRPPKHTRWRPGQSGNPHGRPKGAKGKHKAADAILQRSREVLLEEAQRKIAIRDGDKVVQMSAYQVAVRATFMAAAKGSTMAQRTVMQMTLAVEAELAAILHQAFSTAVKYKEDCALKRRQCRKAGLSEPVFHPNPDDIILDWETLTVEFRGPLTSEQKASLDEALTLRELWERDFESARRRGESSPGDEASLRLIMQSQRAFDFINDSLPERYRKELRNRLPDIPHNRSPRR